MHTKERSTVTMLAFSHHSLIPADAMCWRRAFAGRPELAKAQRKFVDFLLAGCAKADEALFAANELFSNAVEHSDSRLPGGLIVVEVRRWREHAAVVVTDQGGPNEPQIRPRIGGELSERGYGLRTIAATASSWGWYGSVTGRTVTAVFGQ
jgi:serine/threonine-protein kinase RsbW